VLDEAAVRAMYTLPSLRRHVHAIDGLEFELGQQAAYNPYDPSTGNKNGYPMAAPCGAVSRWRKISDGKFHMSLQDLE
jgi:hypothetical protein